MKFAIFGDIHGNIEALRAAYDAAQKAGSEKIYHLGDLGGYSPFVNDVVSFMTAHGIEGVQGNYDEAVANDREHCGCKAEEPLQEEMAHRSFAWTKAHVLPAAKEFMKNLPLEIKFPAEGKKVWLFHATPKKNNLYWFEDRPEKFFREMAEKGDADIMVYGHTHKPYRKDFEGRVFINAGSVGKPKDGDPRASYALLELGPKPRAEIVRVAYDLEPEVRRLQKAGLPPATVERLRSGN